MSQSGRYLGRPVNPGTLSTLTGDTGGPISPIADNINIFGAHGINTAGNNATATIDVAINNAITLGDLSNITAGNDALTIHTGNISLIASNGVGNLNLPMTVSTGDAGVITQVLSGTPQRLMHTWGGATGGLTGNLFVGPLSGNFTLNTTNAFGCTGLGYATLQNLAGASSSDGNTAVGSTALNSLVNGRGNTIVGAASGNLLATSTPSNNDCFGNSCLANATSATSNCLIGNNSFLNATNPSFNTSLGVQSGKNCTGTESSNIFIGYQVGTLGDNHTVRIGTQGTGNGQQNLCFVAGINGNTVSNTALVAIDTTTGQLGTTSVSPIATSFVTDSGTATPSGGILNILGQHGLNTSGSGNTVDVAINNAITLGDLANITAGNDALAIHTGDITLSAANSVGNINLPATVTTGDAGIIKQVVSGTPTNFIHSYGIGTFVGLGAGNTTYTVANAGATTAIGRIALASFTAASGFNDGNTAVGEGALTLFQTGRANTVVGAAAGASLVSSSSGNTLIGANALNNATSGSNNTIIGFGAMATATPTGSSNIVIGQGSASHYTTGESSNIIINNLGVAAESNVIRIGTQGSSTGQQNTCYVAGINGNTVSNQALVTIDTTSGQLGTSVFSEAQTWTPTVVGSSTAGTTTYTAQIGHYTKIGSLVIVQFNVSYSAATGTGVLLIQGLPFTINNTTNSAPSGTIAINAAGLTWPTGSTTVALQGVGGTTEAIIFTYGSASAANQMSIANTSTQLMGTLMYYV